MYSCRASSLPMIIHLPTVVGNDAASVAADGRPVCAAGPPTRMPVAALGAVDNTLPADTGTARPLAPGSSAGLVSLVVLAFLAGPKPRWLQITQTNQHYIKLESTSKKGGIPTSSNRALRGARIASHHQHITL